MGRPADSYDVVIVGAGVIGAALAAELVDRGARVALVERDRVAAGASYGAAGIIGAQTDADAPDAMVDLGLRARALLPALAERLDHCFHLDLTGIVRVAHTEPGALALRRRAAWQRSRGWEARPLDPGEVAALLPGLRRPALAGLWTPDGQLAPAALTAGLAEYAARRGARIWEGVAVRAVVPGRAETTAGTLAAEHVVVAAGAWSRALAPVPVHPVKGQRVLLRLHGHPVRHTLFDERIYVVPKSGGHVLVGGTHEPEAGFDRRPTAAALARLIDAAVDLVPALAAAEVVEPWAGLRPGTPDGLPILGPVPGARGVWLATGHLARGVMLAPSTAERMADALLNGAPLPDAFSPTRFAQR